MSDAAAGGGRCQIPPPRRCPRWRALDSARRLRDVLINQDGVAIGIDEHEARGAGGGFVGGGGEGEAAGLEGPLDLADVVKAGVLDGPARTYDVHGKVVWSGTYRDGKLSGVVTEWLRDTRFETPYVDDKRHGTRKEFDASGRLVSSAEFVNGVYTRQETYHPNGVVASRVTMKGDLGSWTQYSPSGAKTMEGRIVNNASGSALQCVAVYDAEGRSQPCPSP